MLYIKRVMTLARVCWDYMSELNKIEKEGQEYAKRISSGDSDADLGYLEVLDRRRASVRDGFVTPLTKLLHKEGVASMKVKNGVIKLTLKNGSELVFDEEEEGE